MVTLEICGIGELKRTTMVSRLLVAVYGRHVCAGTNIP